MANTYKNIVITPNIDTAENVVPVIQFSGGNTSTNTDINLRVYTISGGTLSFEGSAGQLFSITNDLTNSIFSVNDVSGIPSIDVNANGLIQLSPFGGNVSIDGSTVFVDSVSGEVGIGTDSPEANLHVIGTANVTTSISTGILNAGDFTAGLARGRIFSSSNLVYFQAGTEIQNSTRPIRFAGTGTSVSTMTIDLPNSSVGIGTTLPTSNLNVIGSGNITSYLLVAGMNVVPTIAGANTAVGNGANNYLLTVIAGANTAVGAGANARSLANTSGVSFNGTLYFPTGNVLINRTTDSTIGRNVKLDINGAINTSAVYVNSGEAVLNNVTTLISTGYTVSTFNAGSNISAYGTWQPNPANGNYQLATANGAVTISTPPANCAIDILFVNAASRNPGAVTFSGYNVGSYTGTTYAVTAGNRYILSIREINNISTYSWYALQ